MVVSSNGIINNQRTISRTSLFVALTLSFINDVLPSPRLRCRVVYYVLPLYHYAPPLPICLCALVLCVNVVHRGQTKLSLYYTFYHGNKPATRRGVDLTCKTFNINVKPRRETKGKHGLRDCTHCHRHQCFFILLFPDARH